MVKTSYLKLSHSTSVKKKSLTSRCNNIMSKDLAIPSLTWCNKRNMISIKMTKFQILWPNLRVVIKGTCLTGKRTALDALVHPLSWWRTRLIASSLKLRSQQVRRQMSIFPHSETSQQSCQLPRWHLRHNGLHRQHLPRSNECAESAHLLTPRQVTHKNRPQNIMTVFQSAWSSSTKRWRH